MWLDYRAGGLSSVLHDHPAIRWVQLPWAGVEPYLDVIDRSRIWTSAKGAYAEPVAELALGLLLAGLRGIGSYAQAERWSAPRGTNLLGAKVTILGGGGITTPLLRLLAPLGVDVTVVRRQASDMPGATRVFGTDSLDHAIDGADAVIVALALTGETTGIIDGRRLRLLDPHGWLVNVARGRHVVTDDLVGALADHAIGGAALDVTDPEPLPDGHPLWTFTNCIITPHVGTTPDMTLPLLTARVCDNVRRWCAGKTLVGLVDPVHGY